MEQPQAAFRWPVVFMQPIATSAEAVWDTISQPGNLELFHPFCQNNPVEIWPGPESHDTIQYRSGWVFERRFNRWIDGVGYDLRIGRPGGPQSAVTWRLTPLDRGNCNVSITIYPHVLQNLPLTLRWLPHILWLRPRLKAYLEAVLGGLDWHLTHGRAVSPDQFGTHPWFSAPN